MQTTTAPRQVSFINLAILIPSAGSASFAATLAHWWLWVVFFGYGVSIISLFIIVYAMVRIFELRKREKEFYGTVILSPDEEAGGHPRWSRIQGLAESSSPSEWREAIIEADVMLFDVLSAAGFDGQGVGDKLQSADARTFGTLQDAWEAHKVRNQIAHEGSAFEVSQTIMQRTLQRYENVFREFKAI